MVALALPKNLQCSTNKNSQIHTYMWKEGHKTINFFKKSFLHVIKHSNVSHMAKNLFFCVSCFPHIYYIFFLIPLFLGQSRVYRRIDSICKNTANYESLESMYTQEYLNSIKVAYIPKHELELRVGAPVVLLRNLSPAKGCVT